MARIHGALACEGVQIKGKSIALLIIVAGLIDFIYFGHQGRPKKEGATGRKWQ